LSIRQTAYDDIAQAIFRYSELKKTSPTLYDFDNNNALIRIGYKLLEQEKYQSAIKIFKLSTREFPNHANAFDSLAEAYYLKGDLVQALNNYQISVKLNPKNEWGIRQILKIKARL
jgi:tetratricopeptide (TPR) repeat protein